MSFGKFVYILKNEYPNSYCKYFTIFTLYVLYLYPSIVIYIHVSVSILCLFEFFTNIVYP